MRRRPRACVIGAGIGAVVACELAAAGVEVLVVDEQPRPLAGASGRHGRRLHLGEHYSGDPFSPERRNTAQLCLLGALAFVARWPAAVRGPGRWWQLITTDSMTSPDEYERFLAAQRVFHRELADDGLDPALAFGSPERRHRLLAAQAYAHVVAARRVALAVESVEPQIDAAAFRRVVMEELRGAGVVTLQRSRVLSVEPDEGGYRIGLRGPKGARTLHVDGVVNAAWHGARELTAQVAPADRMRTSTRLRMMAEVRLPPALATLPSMYFHRGPLGNHTNLGGGRALVLAETVSNLAVVGRERCPERWRALAQAGADDAAWLGVFGASGRSDHGGDLAAALAEPVGNRGHALLRLAAVRAGGADPPAERAARTRKLLRDAILAEYGRLVPAIGGAEMVRLIPNLVVSRGDAVMWDPTSAVHRREATVRTPRRAFVELLTGKLTYAVIAAQEAAAQLLADLRGADLAATREAVCGPHARYAFHEDPSPASAAVAA